MAEIDPYRIGIGYDVHALVPNRKLYIGGYHIPHSHGAIGHSDADVLLHALCDALLGATAQGDIGQHFPDTDPKYKNINSSYLLKQVLNMLPQHHILNMDATICLEKPKLAPHIYPIRQNLSKLLDTSPNHISVKATTHEGMGFVGKGKGIAAHVVVLLKGI
ncbi:MAG: 2-C-methyl-D-erythritol 2,4-cyclodiphosphate synthase [Cytophagales bacterium]|nr:2-C-methyl-D-erythritol 2,4-cyclodiphosphate synthase [Cytophagales bacterium]